MATYAKILKDPSGNQILPYTRAKLVYMDDNTTVQDAVLQPATNAQMGRVLIGNNLGYDGKGTISLSKFGVCNALGYTPISPTDYADNNKYGVVKVGSNILEEDGVISVDDRCIKEALGYTPLAKNVLFDSYSMSERNTTKTIGRLTSGYNLDDYLSNFTFNIYNVDNTLFNFYILAHVKSDIIQNSSSLTFVYFRNSPYTGVASTGGDRWYYPIYYAPSGSGNFNFLGTAFITSYDKGKQFNIQLSKFTTSIGVGHTIMLNIPMRIM